MDTAKIFTNLSLVLDGEEPDVLGAAGLHGSWALGSEDPGGLQSAGGLLGSSDCNTPGPSQPTEAGLLGSWTPDNSGSLDPDLSQSSAVAASSSQKRRETSPTV